MKKIFEKHLAEIIVIAVIALSLSSCASMPHHACGITELNKQYSRPCR